MSQQEQEPGSQNNQRLFKQMDAQEQIYAPQQVPGAPGDGSDDGGVRNETIVPSTPLTAIDQPIPSAQAIDASLEHDDHAAGKTPMPGANAIDTSLDRDDHATHSRER